MSARKRRSIQKPKSYADISGSDEDGPEFTDGNSSDSSSVEVITPAPPKRQKKETSTGKRSSAGTATRRTPNTAGKTSSARKPPRSSGKMKRASSEFNLKTSTAVADDVDDELNPSTSTDSASSTTANLHATTANLIASLTSKTKPADIPSDKDLAAAVKAYMLTADVNVVTLRQVRNVQ
jgi:hypothetical protein